MGRNLTADEWRQYLGDRPYALTCPNLPPHPSAVEAGLIAWINTPTWDESRAYLEAHPFLLDPSSDVVLAALLQAYAGRSVGEVQVLHQYAALLQACRTEGIAAAYARLGQ